MSVFVRENARDHFSFSLENFSTRELSLSRSLSVLPTSDRLSLPLRKLAIPRARVCHAMPRHTAPHHITPPLHRAASCYVKPRQAKPQPTPERERKREREQGETVKVQRASNKVFREARSLEERERNVSISTAYCQGMEPRTLWEMKTGRIRRGRDGIRGAR